MPKNNKWICREWEFDIADTNFKEEDFERINLLKKYGNLLNPKIQVSITEKKVRICQKIISHKSLEEFKGVKAANEIVKVFSELTLLKIVHGDLCTSNIGFDKYGRLFADVYVGDIHLNELLIKERYVVEITKKTPVSWLKYKLTGDDN